MSRYTGKFIAVLAAGILMCNNTSTGPSQTKTPEEPGAVYYTVSLTPQPSNGSITLTPQGISSGTGYKYKAAATVTITAVPDSGYSFASWGGDLAGETGAAVNLTLDRDLVASATFTKKPSAAGLAGTWAFSDGIYTSGGVYGTLMFDPKSDTLVLKTDMTYVSNVKRGASINGQNFGGIGSGTWSSTQTEISFTYPVGGHYEYSCSGNSLQLKNGALTLYASRVR